MVVFRAIASSGQVDGKADEDDSPGETAGCKGTTELKGKYEGKQVYSGNFL